MKYLTVRQFEAIFELSSKSLVQFSMEQEHVALHHGKHRYRTWSNSLTRYSFLSPSVFKLYRKLQDYWRRNECFSYLSSLGALIMNENLVQLEHSSIKNTISVLPLVHFSFTSNIKNTICTLRSFTFRSLLVLFINHYHHHHHQIQTNHIKSVNLNLHAFGPDILPD